MLARWLEHKAVSAKLACAKVRADYPGHSRGQPGSLDFYARHIDSNQGLSQMMGNNDLYLKS